MARFQIKDLGGFYNNAAGLTNRFVVKDSGGFNPYNFVIGPTGSVPVILRSSRPKITWGRMRG